VTKVEWQLAFTSLLGQSSSLFAILPSLLRRGRGFFFLFTFAFDITDRAFFVVIRAANVL
jgi:hypothetical protein